MFHLFRAVIDRFKLLLATSSALELEAEALARHAERKAELLRLAQQYESEKLPAVAQELRQHAEALDLKQPLVGVVTSLASWQGADAPPALPTPASKPAQPVAHAASNQRKTR
ncbi:MAG TPA: hypothetical protein VH682_16290 [Gemmataceae bacterium]|jgi:hypothetical protein